MKEIGGYFGLEQLVSNEYHKGLIPLNNGRNTLLYLLKARGIKKIYLPYYLCNSVRDMCSQNDYEFENYNTDDEFMPIFNRLLGNDEYIYIVNYYGQVTDEKVLYLKQQYSRIILDNTQAFFQKPLAGIDTIYSCRKFFGVPDGAYLSTEASLEEELEEDKSGRRMKHILGRYEGDASDYYSDFKENDETFKSEPLKYMSKLTHNILGSIDYERICEIRNENYGYLAENFSSENILKLNAPIGAFAYPFYIENGEEIKRILMQKKIYIPTLWPNVLVDMPLDSVEYNYAANILPLPCDQRYIMTDMQYMVEEMRKCIG